ncbi:unnamed protein product [Alopecurus aequalis]
MLPHGSKKQKTAADADEDADAANLAALPPDVLANVLLWLPASDLRRFRRVCKKWRNIISDQSFMDAHIIHRPRAPTHTIVFYQGRSYADGAHASLNGGGFLFNEQWKLTARFTVNHFEEMIGTCKSLLCFRDSRHGLIRVMEPFTGESIVLPLPPTAEAETCSTASYCFGFDAKARRYKIVYGVFEEKAIYEGYFLGPRMRSTQELQVFTVGADKAWRTVRIRGARRHGVLYGNPACNEGAVYWYSQGYYDGYSRSVRFDLATEEITSERCRLGSSEITCRYLPLLCPEHTIGIRWFGELDSGDGCWSKHIEIPCHTRTST